MDPKVLAEAVKKKADAEVAAAEEIAYTAEWKADAAKRKADAAKRKADAEVAAAKRKADAAIWVLRLDCVAWLEKYGKSVTSQCDFDAVGRVSGNSMPSEDAVFYDKIEVGVWQLPVFAVDVLHASCDFGPMCFPQPIGYDGLSPKVCVVTGPTGSGKTTSLLAWASLAVDPVAFISFGHYDSQRVLEVLKNLLKAFEGAIRRNADYGCTLRKEVLAPLTLILVRGLILDRLNYVQDLDSAGARIRAQADTSLYNKAREKMQGCSCGCDDCDIDAVHIIFDECNVLFLEPLFVPSGDPERHPSNLLSLFIEAAISVSKKRTVSVSGTLQRISEYTRGVSSGSGGFDPELFYVSPRRLSVERIESFFDRYKAHPVGRMVHSEEGGLQMISKRLARARARTLGLLLTAPQKAYSSSLSELIAYAFEIVADIVRAKVKTSEIGVDVLLRAILDSSQLKLTQANGGSALMTSFGIVEPENRPVAGHKCKVLPSARDCWSRGFLHEEEVRRSVMGMLLLRHSELCAELTKITATAEAINPSCGGFFAEVMLAAAVVRRPFFLLSLLRHTESVVKRSVANLLAEFATGTGSLHMKDVQMKVATTKDMTGEFVEEFVGLRGKSGVLRVILPDRLCGADVVVLWRDVVVFFSLKWTNHAECTKSAKQASGHNATSDHLRVFEKLKDSQFVRVVLCLHKSGSGGCEQDLDFERLGDTQLARQFPDRSMWYHVGMPDTVEGRSVTPDHLEEALMKATPVTDLGDDRRRRSKRVAVEKNDGPEMKKRRVE